MATRKQDEKDGRRPKPQQAKEENSTGAYFAVLAITIAILAFGVFVYLGRQASTTGTGFASFKSAFFAAKSAGIYVYYPSNSSSLGMTGAAAAGCADTILSYVSHSRPDIYIYYLNSTACTYSGPVGSKNFTTLNATASFCLNQSASRPSIFLDYNSASNGTTITQGRLYFHGNIAYLEQCSIAPSLT